MERLILRGVMWGADKIPDSVFDKIPGGYYKAKDDMKHKSGDTKKRRHHRRRYSDDEYDEEDRRGRRDRDDGYRSDGYDRRSSARQSYDGGDDDNSNNYDSINDRPRRQRSRADLYRDADKRPSHMHHNADPRVEGGFSYGNATVPPPLSHEEHSFSRESTFAIPTANSPHPSNAPYSPVPNGTIHSPHPPPSAAHRSTSTLRGGIATSYVPYADIYGGPTYQAPSSSETGSIQPNYLNQVAPPTVARQPYQQNPFAQEAPPGAQPAYLPDPYPRARQHEEQADDSQDSRHEHSSRSDDRRYDGDESDTERNYSRSPSRRRHSTRDGRARSRHHERTKSQGRGKSGVRGAFDTSEKGIGYGAVGALAGGLVGSELGKGLVPTAIGTAIGAIGANAFQARERYVDHRGPPSAQMQSMPQPPRRKEDKRNSAYDRRRADEYYAD